MGENSYSTEIERGGKTLILFAAGLRDESVIVGLHHVVAEAFERLADHFKEEQQVLYIRNTSELHGRSEFFWSADFTDTTEATIGIPHWGDNETQIDHLIFAVNQALYTLVRRQHTGASTWFGAEALDRGLSAYYAEVITGIQCPLRLLIKPDRFRRLHMSRYWIHNTHVGRWKPAAQDLWVATIAGLAVAELLVGDDDPLEFCTVDGLTWRGYGSDSLLWVLSHPKRKRSARILEGKVNQPKWSLDRLAAKLPG